MKRTIALAAFALTSSLALAAGTDDAASDAPETTTTTTSETATQSSEETGMNDQMGAEGHDHPADGGQPPAGIAAEENPTYPVDTEVVLTADHMPGMEGAEATIAGAFDTTTYSVSYTPTDGCVLSSWCRPFQRGFLGQFGVVLGRVSVAGVLGYFMRAFAMR